MNESSDDLNKQPKISSHIMVTLNILVKRLTLDNLKQRSMFIN